MNDVADIIFGLNDKRSLSIKVMVSRRARPKACEKLIRRQQVNGEWVQTEVEAEHVTSEFQQFCQAYLKDGVKWAEWVMESPDLRNEAQALWSQLALVASMRDDAFEVPCRLLRDWQKALARRLVSA